MGANIGLLTNIILGIVGALLLNFILSLFGIFTAETYLVQFIVAIVGACLLIFLWRAIRGRA